MHNDSRFVGIEGSTRRDRRHEINLPDRMIAQKEIAVLALAGEKCLASCVAE
jgi:hypothetical protein